MTDPKIKELQSIGKKMDLLLKEGNMDERNRLVEQWRELRKTIDYGYKIGQLVEYLKGKRDWKQSYIKRIDPMWQIEFHDVILPVELIRPIGEKKSEEEQLSLF